MAPEQLGRSSQCGEEREWTVSRCRDPVLMSSAPETLGSGPHTVLWLSASKTIQDTGERLLYCCQALSG